MNQEGERGEEAREPQGGAQRRSFGDGGSGFGQGEWPPGQQSTRFYAGGAWRVPEIAEIFSICSLNLTK